MQVAARTYRAWKKRRLALRTIEDARITDALRALKVPDAKGRPRPEIIYGRRKMTQWLRRNGFPEASKHTVDRLMREAGMTAWSGAARSAPPSPPRTAAAPATC